MPHSRPMPVIGSRCHELRMPDAGHNWRIFYRVDSDAVLVLEVVDKKTRRLPAQVIETCRARVQRYDQDARRR